jgi:molybdopterin synthase catalytic subunit
MIEISEAPISPERVVASVRSDRCGCVATYVGLIRDTSEGKPVLSVEYQNGDGSAESKLRDIADEARGKWPVEGIAICHRIGKLNVGDINLVVAVAAAHRGEGFAAAQYVVDQFKARLPTRKIETYRDGSAPHRR